MNPKFKIGDKVFVLSREGLKEWIIDGIQITEKDITYRFVNEGLSPFGHYMTLEKQCFISKEEAIESIR